MTDTPLRSDAYHDMGPQEVLARLLALAEHSNPSVLDTSVGAVWRVALREAANVLSAQGEQPRGEVVEWQHACYAEAQAAWRKRYPYVNESGIVSLSLQDAALLTKALEPCSACSQFQDGQTGEYPCKVCGVPTVHDESNASPQPQGEQYLAGLEKAAEICEDENCDQTEYSCCTVERIRDAIRAHAASLKEGKP